MTEREPPRFDEPAESTLDPDGADARSLDGAPVPAPEGHLGRGAGGTVLAGPDRHLPRTVAWKVAHGARAKARLAHEARVLAALEHPAIVPIHDLVETDDGGLRIALRIVRGRTLHALVRAAPDLAARLRLVRPFLQAVEAVAWAHRLGYVHRDLKPANLMIGDLGETQVIDWGLAVSLDDAPVDPPGAVVGTLATMSPEQARGEAVTPTFDVWGLGATLFELVAGRPLQPARDALPGGVDALLDRVRRAERPRLVDVCPGAPPELVAIVERCLAPAPEARYPDAVALAADLAAFLDGRRVGAHDYTRWQLFVRFVRAWRLPLGVALAVFVTGAVAAIVAFDRIGDQRDEARAALAARDVEIAERGVVEARRELADDQRPEAELAAARTLAVRESPEARGVLMAYARAPRPVAEWSRALPFDCIDLAVSPDGARILCGTRETFVVLAGDRVAWSYPRPYRGARFIDGGALVLVTRPRAASLMLDAADGALVRELPRSRCESALQTDRAQVGALVLGHSCADLIDARGQASLDVCDGLHIEVAAVATPAAPGERSRVAGLCAGGDLFVVEPDGATRRAPSAIGPAADTLLVAAFVGRDRLVVGGSRGELRIFDLAGRLLVERALPGGTAVRELEADAASDRVVAIAEGHGPMVLVASTLTPLARLPRGERTARLVGASGSDLVTHGATLTRWAFPPGPPAALDGLGGVTSAQVEAAGLVVTHDSSVVVLDPSDGRRRVEATWEEVITKQATVQANTVRVAVAGRRGGEPLLWARSFDGAALEVEELPAMRRVVPLSGGRSLGARTGPALVSWPAPGAALEHVVLRQVIDLGARGDDVAVLYDDPREAVLYDATAAPVEIGRCAVPSATAVAVGVVSPVDPEPVILAVTPAAIVAYRAGDPAVDTDAECTIVGLYGAPRAELARAVATRDGRYVAGGARDGQVHVWQADGTLVASVPAHASAVTTLTVDPDDRWLVSGAWDGRVAFHGLDILAVPRASLVRDIHAAWIR